MGLFVSFSLHIPNDIFVFIITVTVQGRNKPHRLGAEIHRERRKNLGTGRERDSMEQSFSIFLKLFVTSFFCDCILAERKNC